MTPIQTNRWKKPQLYPHSPPSLRILKVLHNSAFNRQDLAPEVRWYRRGYPPRRHLLEVEVSLKVI